MNITSEYIKREALLKKAKELANGSFSTPLIISAIEDAPKACVEKVKHGEWIDNGDRDSNGVAKPFAISCSVCGSSAGTSWMNYCPNCGAKMDLKEGAEE